MEHRSIKLGRTLREGWANFRRNGWLTIATVTVFTLALLVVGLTFIFGLAAQTILTNLENKVDINVAFNVDVPEERILAIRDVLLKYQQIASVEYTSRDAALEQFVNASSDDPNISKALDEIGDNPLPASLTIHARQSAEYSVIANELEQAPFRADIYRINYAKNKKTIETIAQSSRSVRQTGIVLATVFILVSLIIAFNTIRINMYSRRQEFEIMRLVGASNIYMRLPSVFEGALYGALAALIATFLIIPAIHMVGSSILLFVAPDFLMAYYTSHWLVIMSALLLGGAGLGALSGYLALSKYLKV
jgi:cell division transport system permease protein